MKLTRIALVFAASASILSYADSSQTARRDKALDRINTCLRRNEVSSRQCKKLNENVETLVDVYRGGDKSVLPTLFRFTYLTDFYGEALLSDPDGFLTTAARLPPVDQEALAAGIAGGMFRRLSRKRFEAIRVLLSNIPETLPTKQIAQLCLKALDRNNASLFVNYFPPQTFTSRAADLEIYWYSRDMYTLGETPLWPPPSRDETTYRLTHLGAFTGPKVVTLTVQPDGSGRLRMKALSQTRETTQIDDTATVPQELLARFFTDLDQARFWDTQTELPSHGTDGAEWILEGVQNGKYRTVVRWCPDIDGQSAEETAFAKATRLLFELAGHKQNGAC